MIIIVSFTIRRRLALKQRRNIMVFKLCALKKNGKNPCLGIRMIATSRRDRENLKKLRDSKLTHGSFSDNSGVIYANMFLNSSKGHTLKKCGFAP